MDTNVEKVNIESLLIAKGQVFSNKSKGHIRRMFAEFGFDTVFGRSAIVKILGLQDSSASKLISKLLKAQIIKPVSGYGKGKYKFSTDLNLN